jgi:flagellar assembly protein FliH
MSSEEGQEVYDPEEQASKQYQNEVQVRHDAEEISDAFEQAKAKGFETGFKQGEEKAEIHAREKTSEMMGKVAEILSEFKTLKHEVLNNVQENFYEIAQAVAEALLKREFRLNPETFAQVVRRAIDDALAPDTFKIKVHPETYELVSKLDQEDIVKALVKDTDIEVGDFKIESDLSVVDGNIRKVISELLQHADLDLFEKADDDDEKAG